LHWSNFPREDELQITFKFVFPLECLLNEELEELTKEATAVRQWQYSYEWSHGLLLRHDAVRIGIAQHGDSILEVSGRVDIADVEEDSEDTPMRLVWPYLSIVINVVLKYLNKISITFQVNLFCQTI
uniref:Transmembrane 9 superfamily member n=1 Tax=Toxocara canis TaxID=6265 RepID=A0A183TXL6_TOXCA